MRSETAAPSNDAAQQAVDGAENKKARQDTHDHGIIKSDVIVQGNLPVIIVLIGKKITRITKSNHALDLFFSASMAGIIVMISGLFTHSLSEAVIECYKAMPREMRGILRVGLSHHKGRTP